MTKKIQQFLLLQLLLSSVIYSLWLVGPKSDRYQHDYLHGIQDMKQRLVSNDQTNRLVLLGGSSLGFSVSARKIGETLDVPVYNLGLHGGVGFTNIWDQFEPVLDPSIDTIVLSPEYNLITSLAKHSEEFCRVIYLQRNQGTLAKNIACFPDIFKRSVIDIFAYLFKLEHPRNIYFREALNKYGDVESHMLEKNRDVNFLSALDTRPSVQKVMEYIDYINTNIVSKGFKVIYVPVVIPESSCENNLKYILQTQSLLLENLSNFKFEGEYIYCYPDEYFFNTVYHMNSIGKAKLTRYYEGILTTKSSSE